MPSIRLGACTRYQSANQRACYREHEQKVKKDYITMLIINMPSKLIRNYI